MPKEDEIPFFAFGNIAVGYIAVGNVAVGVVAVGLSVAVGPIAIGLNALGWLVAIGLNGIGGISLAAINGAGLFTLAGVNGIGALYCMTNVNHGTTVAVAPVFAAIEAMAFVLMRPKPAHPIPTVPLARIADGQLSAGEVEARLVEAGDTRGVLEQRGRRVPIEIMPGAISADERRALSEAGTGRVRVSLVTERRAGAHDAERGYRSPGAAGELVIMAARIQHRLEEGRFKRIMSATLLLAAIASAAALVLGLATSR